MLFSRAIQVLLDVFTFPRINNIFSISLIFFCNFANKDYNISVQVQGSWMATKSEGNRQGYT